jgi:hypothetical protein
MIYQANDTGFHALAHTSARVASFTEAVNDLVYDVLIAKVRARLANVSAMHVWGAEQEENAFDLPSFSSYASPYISSIGEYLLTLPQQLEPLIMGSANGLSTDNGEGNTDEDQLFATEWMFKVYHSYSIINLALLIDMNHCSELITLLCVHVKC